MQAFAAAGNSSLFIEHGLIQQVIVSAEGSPERTNNKGRNLLSTVAIAIICKTPSSGSSKTRLSPPLRPDECAAISACFIHDLSKTIQELVEDGGVVGYAIYTPRGTEAALRRLLPDDFRLLLQVDGAFGARLLKGAIDLFD